MPISLLTFWVDRAKPNNSRPNNNAGNKNDGCIHATCLSNGLKQPIKSGGVRDDDAEAWFAQLHILGPIYKHS